MNASIDINNDCKSSLESNGSRHSYLSNKLKLNLRNQSNGGRYANSDIEFALVDQTTPNVETRTTNIQNVFDI